MHEEAKKQNLGWRKPPHKEDKMKFEITLTKLKISQAAPTQGELKEYLEQFLSYRNSADSRNYGVESAKVVAKRK